MIFTREDTPTIMDGMVVRYRRGNLEISASRNGVYMTGMGGFTKKEDLADLKKYLQLAFSQYLELSKGHEPLSMGIEEIAS